MTVTYISYETTSAEAEDNEKASVTVIQFQQSNYPFEFWRYCPKCGWIWANAYWQYCPYCGSELDKDC